MTEELSACQLCETEECTKCVHMPRQPNTRHFDQDFIFSTMFIGIATVLCLAAVVGVLLYIGVVT